MFRKGSASDSGVATNVAASSRSQYWFSVTRGRPTEDAVGLVRRPRVVWGRLWPSRSRTQTAALGGAKGKVEDAEMRSLPQASSGRAGSADQPPMRCATRALSAVGCVAVATVLLLVIAPQALAARGHIGELPEASTITAVTVDASNDVWVARGENGEQRITEYSPYPADAKLQEWSGEGKLDCPGPVESLAVDDVTDYVYASDYCSGIEPGEPGVDVFESNGAFKESLQLGKAQNQRLSKFGNLIAIDNSGGPSNGRIYVVGYGTYPNNEVLAAFEPNGSPAGLSVAAPYISENYILGAPVENVAAGTCGTTEVLTEGFYHFATQCFSHIDSIAVGQREGDVYVAVGAQGKTFEFDSSGAFVTDHLHNAGELAEDSSSGNLKIGCAEFTQSDQEVGSLPCGFAAFDSRGYLYVGGQIYDQVPKIAYEDATEPTPTAGTVNASVTPPPGEEITACKVEYGATKSYGESAQCEPETEPYSTETQVQARISGLTTETTYHYRLVLETAAGETPGNDQTYTPHYVVGLRTDPATEVKATMATLNASFVGNGEETHYYFEYGSTASYGETTAVPPGQSAGSPDNAPARTGLSAAVAELDPNTTYHYRVVAENGPGNSHTSYGEDRTFRTGKSAPLIREFVSAVHSESLVLDAHLNPGGAATTYHFEYGLAPCSSEPDPCTSAPLGPELEIGGVTTFRAVSTEVTGLKAGTLYYYRLLATNSLGTTKGPDATFATFPYVATLHDACPNALSRQQTGAALALDCRSYELVSAADAGGYDVESDLVPGQTPFAGYPRAQEPERVLYAVHAGGVPGTDHPTNRGLDPYVATRGEAGWSTEYVGIPADDPFATEPFSSTPTGADAGLGTFAFGGPGSCSPCFGPGGVETGIPVRLASGELVQGMVGAPGFEPGPSATSDGYVAANLSANGEHLIFASTSRFAPGGSEGGNVSVYDRDLRTGETHVVSNAPSTEDFPVPLPCLQGEGKCDSAEGNSNGISELAISTDGSRVLLGQKVSEDADHNVYWHLYMDVGDSVRSIDLTPGVIAKHGEAAEFSEGVLFDGISEDGSKVFFTTKDKLLAGDTDESADIYVAEVGESAAHLKLVSTGPSGPSNSDACDPLGNKAHTHWNSLGAGASCDALAVAGGVAAAGDDVYFLSPELLDGASNGTENQPNLYLAGEGSAPRFIATLSPNDSTVLDSLAQAGKPHSADFQLTPSGRFAAFTSVLSLTGYENAGFSEVYRYDAAAHGGEGGLGCASCNPTNAAAVGGSGLASNGLSLTESGQVFFNSNDVLALRDTDNLQDVYEWEPLGTGSCEAGGPTYSTLFQSCLSLISSGTSPFPSSLLSASENGTDVYFFTHDSLAPQDHNGPLTKIYDARSDGGFFELSQSPPCASSEECHGAGSPAPSPPQIGTVLKTSEGNAPAAPQPPKCRKGFARAHGRCVKKHVRAHHRKGKRGHRHG